MDKPKPTRLETQLKLDMLKRLTDQTECAPYRERQKELARRRQARFERMIRNMLWQMDDHDWPWGD